jgi:formate dehydrogenase major subunit
MTNHWNDIANSDVIIAIGSNPAENHPAAFGHITEGMGRGASLISIDPRFTRTSAKADIYAPMRSGTDIAFIDGMIKYVLDEIERQPEKYNMTYITEYTNAAYLIDPGFKGPVDLDGLFSGYAGSHNETDGNKRKYDKSTWQFQTDSQGIPLRDKTLTDPNCVFQLMKTHFARYTPEMVSSICGTPKEVFLDICRTYAATGQVGKAGTILYAMGTTQHTYGAQNIRSYCILQLLLGNIGIAGGGINAMRGESNVQGSTDHCLLFHILPGYLKVPVDADTSLSKYLERTTPTSNDPLSANWWQHTPKYMVSLLKAWYGDAATSGNEFGLHYLPKIDAGKNYSHIALFEAMDAGIIKGLMCWGQNPAVGGPNANLERSAMDKLDWLLVTDIWHTETASFWKRPGANPADIQTEVFLLPALNSYEKEGSVTNSGRWSQWRYKCADGPGDADTDLWMLSAIYMKLKELYAAEGGPNAEAITRLTWEYGGEHPDVHMVAKEINGYDLTTGKLLPSFGKLKDDGTTTSGNWLYCASYTEDGNMAARRDLTPGAFDIGLFPKWSWCWPVNRRIIYNRASVDLNGVPWDKEHPVVWWQNGKWVGDVPDGGWPPMAVDPARTKYPFIMKPDGLSRMFGPGMAEGPLPEHYEPWEAPVDNLISRQQSNPAFKIWRPEEQGTPDRYPIVCTTYRLVEHWQGGQMTRNQSWLVELQPEPFVEMSEELADEKSIRNGERVIVETTRGQVNMVAIVTKRFRPFKVNGTMVHQVGMPWHWGFIGLSKGDSANVLTPHVGDANTMIPEYKAFLCDIRKA